MRAKAIAAGLALIVVTAIAAPSSSSAATRHAHRPASTYLQLRLHGSSGYRLEVTEGIGHRATLLASHGLFSNVGDVFYSTPDLADDLDSGTVDVRFGRFGRFHGRLAVTSVKHERPERRCTGEPTTTESGVFVGTFRFRGAEGFTQVRTRRARGSIVKQPEQTCAYSVPGHRSRLGLGKSRGHGARLPDGEDRLVASDLGGVFFEAEHQIQEPGESADGSTSFQASASEKLGRLSVDHFAFVSDFGRDLGTPFEVPNLADQLAEAVVAPPAPFSGSATFLSDGARSGTWSGDLAVQLPGLPAPVPLTGGGIEAGLCAGRAGCTKTLPAVLQPVLEAPPGVVVAVSIKRKH